MCVNIPIHDDTFVEDTENFTILLMSTDAVDFTNSDGTVLILDNDGTFSEYSL